MIQRAFYSDPGKRGIPNEDACALPPPGVDESRLGILLAIADGTGGLPGGEEASQEAVRYVQSLYYAAPNPENLPDRLRQSVEQVNALNRLSQRLKAQEQGHLTTLVVAVIHTNQIWVANVGDSRAYLVNGARRNLTQLTEDHSDHVRNVKVGLVDSADLASRDSGIITRAIGLQDDCQVDIYHYTWNPGDRLLLCSDGLSHLQPETMVTTILDNPPEKAAHDLVANAIETDGSDNCTAVVAAWPSPDQSGFDSSEAGMGRSRPILPLADAEISRQHFRLSPPRWPRLHPGVRWILLGMLLGWLTAILLAFLLGPERTMMFF
jgi:PPM family protein phosphatase